MDQPLNAPVQTDMNYNDSIERECFEDPSYDAADTSPEPTAQMLNPKKRKTKARYQEYGSPEGEEQCDY